MKRVISTLSALTLVAASQAFTLFDSFNSTGGTSRSLTGTSSTPRSTMAGAITTAGSGLFSVTDLSFTAINRGTATLTNFYVTVSIFDAVNQSATPVFTNSVYSQQWSVTTSLNQNYYTKITINPANVKLSGGHNYGVVLSFLNSAGAKSDDITTLISYGDPLAAGSSLGWYRDASNDGIIGSSEARTFNLANESLALSINGTAVPEPTTLAVLGIGLVALAKRRRNLR